MKRHQMVGVAVVGVFVFAGVLAIRFIGWWTIPVGALVVAVAWLGGHCWHSDISLLPPVPGGGPDREYARWHCNRCGATWAAGLESTTRPRTLHHGYDQTKAEQAAARADALERERRRLAIERAGLAGKRDNGTRPAAVPPVAAAVAASLETASPALTRVAAGGRVRRLSVDAGAASLDDGRLAHRRPADNLPRIRPLRG